MNALRYILKSDENGNLTVNVPNGGNKKFEIIVLPAGEEIEAGSERDDSFERMLLQQESGFAKKIIGSAEEDVWNELI